MCATARSEMIARYNSGSLQQMQSVISIVDPDPAADRRNRHAPVVSVVGAGGKSTLLRRMAAEYLRAGQQVFVTTTTHIMKEDSPWFLADPEEASLKTVLEKYGQVWTGMSAPGCKLKALPPEIMKIVFEWNIPVLIEADGAKRLPLKVPAAHEPVIVPQTTHVFSVYGLDSVGRTFEQACFRKELAGRLLNKKVTEYITEEDIAQLAASECGGRKACPDKAGYTVVLNKADDTGRTECAVRICRELEERGITDVLITSGEKGGK